jgi:hypothetical protein
MVLEAWKNKSERLAFGEGLCISYFYVAVTKIPDRKT